jgi:serine/threonine-protein kinase RsbT
VERKDTNILSGELRTPIVSSSDLVEARHKGRAWAGQLGFSSSERTLIATAISELARNIIRYARQGEIIMQVVNDGPREGVAVVAQDNGPGIADIDRALQEGYSTSGGLGLGLPGVRRIMDEFDIESELGRGTTVTIKKWKR